MKENRWIRLATLIGIALLIIASPGLSACGEKEVVKEVIKEVPVEKEVVKEVVKEVPVEREVVKEVVKEVPVEKVVEKEVVREQMNLTIGATKIGSVTHMFALGLAKVINEQHPWIRATAAEFGTSQSCLETVGIEEWRKENHMFVTHPWGAYSAVQGLSPYTRSYPGVRYLFHMSDLIIAVVTQDPELKTFTDLEGKKIAAPPVSHLASVAILQPLLQAAGLEDKVEITHLSSWGDINRALTDGIVDAALTYGSWKEAESMAYAAPHHIQLSATLKDKLHYVDTPEDIATRAAGYIYGMSRHRVAPAKSFDEHQQEPVGGTLIASVDWAVFEEFPEEAVYEVVKTLFDNFEAVELAAGGAMQGLSRETFFEGIPPESEIFKIHPGAVRFYEEAGYIE